MIELIIILFTSILFGFFLKINDLFADDNFYWFRGGSYVIIFSSSLFGLLMLFFSSLHLKLFWLGIILSWILRGKIDHLFHGVVIFILVFYLLFLTKISYTNYLNNLLFVSIPLSIIGIIHDRVKTTYRSNLIRQKITVTKMIFLKFYWLFWIILSIFYVLNFNTNFSIIISITGFLVGYTSHYSNRIRKLLSNLGIKSKRKT